MNDLTQQATNLMGLDRQAMEAYFDSIGEKSFRASQVMKWIHQVGVSDFNEMTNLSKALRASLADKAQISVPQIISDNLSEDGTRKWLLKVPGKSAIEMVFIPEETRGTLCVSSCLLYTSPSPRDKRQSRMPSSA